MNRFIVIFIIIIGFSTTKGIAQKALKLNDITKFELIMSGHGVDSNFKKLEGIPENNGWNSYQTRGKYYNKNKLIDDSSRTFVKHIPDTILNRLLEDITTRDTGININLNTDKLISMIDGLGHEFKPVQKDEFIKLLQSTDVAKKALDEELYHSAIRHDSTLFSIKIFTKNNGELILQAFNRNNLYNLPWHSNNITIYNPDISIIYYYILGNNESPISEKYRLYYYIDGRIFGQYFETRFNWDDFKSDHPKSFAILKNTLYPNSFYLDGTYATINFSSSRLPKYVQIERILKIDDTVAVSACKQYEDTLVKIFKHNSFLFRYSSTRPGLKMLFVPLGAQELNEYILDELKSYFPRISAFDYKKIRFIKIYHNKEIESVWLLLPDNTFLLLMFYGTTNKKNIRFTDYKINLPDDSLKRYRNVCVVFDSSGKIIHNYGDVDMIIP